MWDKDREDWSGFIPNPAPTATLNGNGISSKNGTISATTAAGTRNLVVTRPTGGVDKKGVSTAKFNPVSHWRVSTKSVAGKFFWFVFRQVLFLWKYKLKKYVLYSFFI